jgi:Lar family restriction alleviation protein
MSELKRCPFCGGEVKLHISELDAFRNVYSFLCNDCDMEIIYPYSNEEEAVKAWNTRKTLERIVERLEESLDKTMEENSQEWDSYYRKVNVGKCVAFRDAIEIVKEEGEMNE